MFINLVHRITASLSWQGLYSLSSPILLIWHLRPTAVTWLTPSHMVTYGRAGEKSSLALQPIPKKPLAVQLQKNKLNPIFKSSLQFCYSPLLRFLVLNAFGYTCHKMLQKSSLLAFFLTKQSHWHQLLDYLSLFFQLLYKPKTISKQNIKK